MARMPLKLDQLPIDKSLAPASKTNFLQFRGQIMMVIYRMVAEQLGGFIISQVPPPTDQLNLVEAMTSL